MKTTLRLLSVLLLAMACAAQTPVTLATSNAQQPSINTVAQTGATGTTQYCYWVVAVYAGGKSGPAGPLCTNSSNSTLSSSNYNTVTFSAPTSPLAAVSSYDLLRTTTQTPPTGACACAVSTAQSGSPLNDQSNTLSAYTVATLASVNVSVVGDNVTTSGVVLGKLLVNGVTTSFPTAAGGLTAAYFCGATTGSTTCANTATNGTARVIGGIATLASNSAVISAISPAFTSTTTYACVANDLTTRASPVQVANTSASSITITNTTGASDVINWVCVGY